MKTAIMESASERIRKIEAFSEAIKPITEMRVNILNLYPPKYTLVGRVLKMEMPKEYWDRDNELEALQEEIRMRYFGE